MPLPNPFAQQTCRPVTHSTRLIETAHIARPMARCCNALSLGAVFAKAATSRDWLSQQSRQPERLNPSCATRVSPRRVQTSTIDANGYWIAPACSNGQRWRIWFEGADVPRDIYFQRSGVDGGTGLLTKSSRSAFVASSRVVCANRVAHRRLPTRFGAGKHFCHRLAGDIDRSCHFSAWGARDTASLDAVRPAA